MVHVPGGDFWMGSQSEELTDALPIHKVHVDAFSMDKTEVTNAEFEAFVNATGYVTVAERPLDPKDFPDVPAAKLKPGGVVFSAPHKPVSLDDPSAWWSYVAGANWRHPDGPQTKIIGKATDPVVQIAWEDAAAYAQWAHKRLPTEAEWEFAARAGLDRNPYTWGTALKPGGRWQANIFEGHFPDRNSAEDGYAGRAPVASYKANGYGLFDMAGNVWEWCADWYRADYYKSVAIRDGVARNPPGPATSFDPQEPDVPKRVQRGGSFLCTGQYCERYTPGARGKGDPNTPTNHVGFRCVADD
jgi:formylglycine-generating enzyme